MLLDEPFAGLNRVAAEQVTSMLQRLKGDGIGGVIVEHEMALLLPLLNPLKSLLVTLAVLLGALSLNLFVFHVGNLVLPLASGLLLITVLFALNMTYGYFVETRGKRQITSLFGQYVPPELVDEMSRNPESFSMEGESREMTVLFTDVRGFTRISEQFDPPGLTRFMNRFLTPMTELILSHGGTIDKYMGDAIMAFWNAPLDTPDHPARACATALAMQARLQDLNAEWEEEARKEQRLHSPVNIGIGLNTGAATVGNFGSAQRLTYSCLGDEVNLASRLEGLCKLYGVGLIIGERTTEAVPGLAGLELDRVMVKGKTEPERITALLGDADFASKAQFAELSRKQAEFLEAYRRGAFVEALATIDGCVAAAEAVGWRQGYYAMMRERVEGLIAEPPSEWTGVYVAKEK